MGTRDPAHILETGHTSEQEVGITLHISEQTVLSQDKHSSDLGETTVLQKHGWGTCNDKYAIKCKPEYVSSHFCCKINTSAAETMKGSPDQMKGRKQNEAFHRGPRSH